MAATGPWLAPPLIRDVCRIPDTDAIGGLAEGPTFKSCWRNSAAAHLPNTLSTVLMTQARQFFVA